MWIYGQNTCKISVKKFSFSKFAEFQRLTWLKMNYFTNIVQGFYHIFQNTYFLKNLSQAAYGLLTYALFTNKL